MKKIINIIFYIIASMALGFGIASQLNHATQLWYLIPYIVAGVGYLAAFITSGVIIHEIKSHRNDSVNLQKKDLILQVNEIYTVSKRGKVRPGEYKVLATDEENKKFNLRINDYVKEYQHNTTLILAEGDTISARSSNVILR